MSFGTVSDSGRAHAHVSFRHEVVQRCYPIMGLIRSLSRQSASHAFMTLQHEASRQPCLI